MTTSDAPGELSRLLREVARAPDASPPAALVGARMGRYVLIERVGKGGMGDVWRARDDKLERDVAIKLLANDALDDAERRRRFLREARALAALVHPGIAAIHDVDEQDGVPFIAMELVPGESLRALLARGPLPSARARALALDVARALAFAHAAGVVHRDLKPENVRVLPDGRAKLIDFGLARIERASARTPGPAPAAGIDGAADADAGTASSASNATREGTVLGTPGYMSPEQIEGKSVDARSDVFSFGVVLWEMITGASPWPPSPTSPVAAAAAVLRDEPRAPPPGADPALVAVARRALAKAPAERFANGAALLAALDVPARASSPARRALGVAPWLALACVAAFVVVGALAGLPDVPTASRAAADATGDVTWGGDAGARLVQLTDDHGPELHPAISPDGKMVVYSKLVDGALDLFLLRVGGDRPIRLTETPDDETHPRFSPDASTIAFVRRGASGAAVWTMGATGESSRKLIDDAFRPAWSPDGKELYYGTRHDFGFGADPRSELRAIDTATLEVRTVSPIGTAPALAPDGASLAFMASVDAHNDVYVASLEDGVARAPRRLMDDAFVDRSPAWTPDGALLFVSDRGGVENVWRLAMDAAQGGAPAEARPLTFNTTRVSDIDVAPTGAVAFAAGSMSTTLVGFDLDDEVASPRPFASPSSRAISQGSLDVADDGSVVLIHLDNTSTLVWTSADARERRILAKNARTARFVDGGRRVVFTERDGPDRNVVSIAIDGSDRRVHGGDGARGSLPTSDGRRAFIVLQDERSASIAQLDLETGATKVLYTQPGELWLYDRSPDDDALVVAVGTKQSQIGWAIFDVEARELQPIDLGPELVSIWGSTVRFFGDRSRLVFGRGNDVILRDVDDPREERLTSVTAEAQVSDLARSPDGEVLAVSIVDHASDLWLLEPSAAAE